jgi:hypothetical protein
MRKTSKDSADAFRFAADEAVDIILNNGEDEYINNVMGCLQGDDEYKKILGKAAKNEDSKITTVMAYILKNAKSLPDAVVMIHIFSSMEMAARINDDPSLLMNIMLGGK